jgi:hypothetical protein
MNVTLFELGVFADDQVRTGVLIKLRNLNKDMHRSVGK